MTQKFKSKTKIKPIAILAMFVFSGIPLLIFINHFSANPDREGVSPPRENYSVRGERDSDFDTGDDDFYRANYDKFQSGQEGGPVEVVNAYYEAMELQDGRPDLHIYSEDTVEMLENWTVTHAQMASVASERTHCHVDKSPISGDIAVVRHKVTERECAPYFLVKERGEWKLNLTMMQKTIRFNNRNQWHFDINNLAQIEPYDFAFSDWKLDKHGYPHQSR